MSIVLGTNINYQGHNFLDNRQNKASTQSDLRNWSISIPQGFEVYFDNQWYIYRPDLPKDSLTGYFHPRTIELQDTLEDVDDKITKINRTSVNYYLDNKASIDSIKKSLGGYQKKLSSKTLKVSEDSVELPLGPSEKILVAGPDGLKTNLSIVKVGNPGTGNFSRYNLIGTSGESLGESIEIPKIDNLSEVSVVLEATYDDMYLSQGVEYGKSYMKFTLQSPLKEKSYIYVPLKDVITKYTTNSGGVKIDGKDIGVSLTQEERYLYIRSTGELSIKGILSYEAFREHTEDTDIHVTPGEKETWENKLDVELIENLGNPPRVNGLEIGFQSYYTGKTYEDYYGN